MARPATQEVPMSELTDLVDEHYRGLNTGDIDLSMKSHADNVEVVTPNGPLTGREAFREFGQAFLTAASDAKITPKRIVESSDTVVVEGTFSGTNDGPLPSPNGPIPATGKPFAFDFADIMVVKDGQVVVHHIYW